MVTGKEALEAAKKIREYCQSMDRSCDNCIFGDVAPADTIRDMCFGDSLPESWEFDDDETDVRIL